MHDWIKIIPPHGPLKGEIRLPASKSESNRALILRALSQGRVSVSKLAESRDTQTMIDCLATRKTTVNVGIAGTVMRFLTAYLAFGGEDRVVTGAERMLKRPIGPLVEALRELGAKIDYLGEEGYPPLLIRGSESVAVGREVSIKGNVSSQFISALLMIAPTLPRGLELNLIEPVFSVPYIKMTLEMLGQCGIFHHWVGNTIKIPHQFFKTHHLTIEPDWSAASYAYAMCALSPGSKLVLPGLKRDSLQGDRWIAEFMEKMGVESTFSHMGLTIEQKRTPTPQIDLGKIDFTGCPDLAQTLAVLLGSKSKLAILTGLDSLRIKETDRIMALQYELRKFGIQFVPVEHGFFLEGEFEPLPNVLVHTYEDHRMALSFAPLALVNESLRIEDPEVVDKSFPHFWEELEKIGFRISRGN